MAGRFGSVGGAEPVELVGCIDVDVGLALATTEGFSGMGGGGALLRLARAAGPDDTLLSPVGERAAPLPIESGGVPVLNVLLAVVKSPPSFSKSATA